MGAQCLLCNTQTTCLLPNQSVGPQENRQTNSNQILPHSWLHTVSCPVSDQLSDMVAALEDSYMLQQWATDPVHEDLESCLPSVWINQAPNI